MATHDFPPKVRRRGWRRKRRQCWMRKMPWPTANGPMICGRHLAVDLKPNYLTPTSSRRWTLRPHARPRAADLGGDRGELVPTAKNARFRKFESTASIDGVIGRRACG